MTRHDVGTVAEAGSSHFAGAPPLPQDADGPVFAEAWQAQAFALTMSLHNAGYFSWPEWTAALASELQHAAVRGELDDGSRYYECWVAALEALATVKGLVEPEALLGRKAAWHEAYCTTPHGQPVELKSS